MPITRANELSVSPPTKRTPAKKTPAKKTPAKETPCRKSNRIKKEIERFSPEKTPSRKKAAAAAITPGKSTAKIGRPRKPQQQDEDYCPDEQEDSKQTPKKPRGRPKKQQDEDYCPDDQEDSKQTPKKPTGRPKKPKPNTAKKPDDEDDEQQMQIDELNIYQRYKHALSTTIKSELVFREQETNEIKSFLTDHLKKSKSTSIYISGPPGTGKTATVTAILDELKKDHKFEKIIFFNGMAFTSEINFFNRLLFNLTDEDSKSKDLTPLIVEALSKPNAKPCVLVVDEIDTLDSNHQKILYTIFNLPMYKSAKVIIIGIANTLDFTSTKLVRYHTLNITPMKEFSFQPYDPAKLTGILKSRIRELDGEPLFQQNAVEFCAKKVASYSGDARKALEILRRSVELVEQEVLQSLRSSNLLKDQNNQDVCKSPPVRLVGIPHVMKIVNQVYSDKFVEACEDDYNFPIQQKIVLCVMLLMLREGSRNPELGKCFDRLIKINKEKALNLEISSANIFMDMCETLESKSFISIQRSKDLRCTKLSLSIAEEEAKELLKNNYVTKCILFA